MLSTVSNFLLPKESPHDVIKQIVKLQVVIMYAIEESDPKKQEKIGVEISIFLFFLADYIVSSKKKDDQVSTPWLIAAFKKMKEVILKEEPYFTEDLVADMLVQRIQLYTKMVKKINIQKEDNEFSTYLPSRPFFEEFDVDYNPDTLLVIATILNRAYKSSLSDYIKLLKRYSRSPNNTKFDSLG
jgi:hypothetical protein